MPKRVASPKLFFRLFLLVFLVASGPLRAATADQEYLKILDTIERADGLKQRGQTAAAKAKYEEARTALLSLKRDNPGWNVKVVAYRVNFLAEQISLLSKPAAVTATNAVEVKPANPVASPAVLPASPPVALPPNTQVRLVGGGGEPRKALRFQAKAGEKQSAVVTVTMAAESSDAPGMKKMPPLKIVLSATTQSPSPEGDIRYDLVVDDISVVEEPGVNPQLVQTVKGAYAGLKGAQYSCTMSDYGFTREAKPKMPAGSGPAAQESIDQIKDSFSGTELFLPHEPIGPGAKWEVKKKIDAGGLAVDLTIHYQLVSIDGTVAKIRSSITQSAGRQKIVDPTNPQAQVDLVRFAGTASVTMTVDLAKILPVQAVLNDTTDIVMAMGAGPQKVTTTVKKQTALKVEAK